MAADADADLRIAHFRYGTALDITAGPLGRYAMNFTLDGVSRVRHGGQRAAAATGAATIFSPVAESELTWSSDLELLCLMIPGHALEQHFRKLTGIDEPVHFRPGVDPGAAHLARSMLMSILRLTVGGTVNLPDPLAWELRNALLEAVHDALLCARPQDTTVTRVAAEVGGFFHLGRFAGEYLAMFGEHPLDTLRSSLRISDTTPSRDGH